MFLYSLLRNGMVASDISPRKWFKLTAHLQHLIFRFVSICLSIQKLDFSDADIVVAQIMRCGPPAMNKAVAAHLDIIGYSADMQFQF